MLLTPQDRCPCQSLDDSHPSHERGIYRDLCPRAASVSGRAAVPARRDLGRRRRQLRALLRARDQRRALPVRLGRRGDGVADHSAARADRHGLARLPARRAAGPALRLPRPRPVRRRSTGHRFNPHKLCSIPTPRRSAARLRWDDALFGYTHRRSRRRPVARRARQRRRTRRSPRSSTRRSPGATTAPPRTPWHETVIYELHVKGFTKLHPGRAGDAARHLRRAGLARPAIRHLHVARRHRRRAAAGASPRRRPAPGRAGPEQLLGLQHARRTSRPTCAIARRAAAARGGARVQDDGARAARRRPRGDPRRRLQPHRRGQSARADAVAARHRQRVLLPAARRTTRATTWTSPAAATR